MSSQTDIEALSAKVRRLERLFETQQRESAAEPKDRAIQSAVSTGSSEPALQAEISRLQDVIAAKDAEIASKDAQLERLYRKHSDLIKSITSFENGLNETARDMHHTTEAAAAGIDDLPPEDSTLMIDFTDTDRSSKPASSSPPKDVEYEGETKPKTLSFGLTRTKAPAFTVPTPPSPAKPYHPQVLESPNAGPSFGNRAFPPIVILDGFSGTKARKPQTPSNQPKQKQLVKRKSPPSNGEQKIERGSTSHDQSLKMDNPLTARQEIPETARETTSTKAKEGASSIESADQLPRKPDINLQKAPAHEHKDDPSRVSAESASSVVTTDGYILDNRGERWSAWKIGFATKLRSPIPPEVKAAFESGELPVPATDNVKDDSSVSSDSDPSDAASLESVDSPPSKPETGDSSLAKTSSLSVKKRLAEEDQPDTEAPVKRLRST